MVVDRVPDVEARRLRRQHVVVVADRRQRVARRAGNFSREGHGGGGLAHRRGASARRDCRASARRARRPERGNPSAGTAAPDAPAATGTRRWRRSRRPEHQAAMSRRPRARTECRAVAPSPSRSCRARCRSRKRPPPASARRAVRSNCPARSRCRPPAAGEASGTCASRSRAGRVRSSSNFRYCVADQSGRVAVTGHLLVGCRPPPCHRGAAKTRGEAPAPARGGRPQCLRVVSTSR